MRFPEGFHVLHFQACFGYGVNEYKIKLAGAFGNAVGDEETRVGGFQTTDFLLEGVTEAFFNGAVKYSAGSGQSDVLDDKRDLLHECTPLCDANLLLCSTKKQGLTY